MSEIVTNITWGDFVERFKPIKNHLDDNASWDEFMFETFGDEVAFVKAQDPHTIWTVVDDGDNSDLVSGWHFVNRMGYLITEVPWPAGKVIQILDENKEST